MRIVIRPVIAVERVGRATIARHVEGHAQIAGDSYSAEDNERSARDQLAALAQMVDKRRKQHPRLCALLTRL